MFKTALKFYRIEVFKSKFFGEIKFYLYEEITHLKSKRLAFFPSFIFFQPG